ncbi:cytochrome P450 [Rhodopila sp.]|uniref:cytochrome P450 n=1 Tax=Rhodopila sp. TaxID=2480087 RepID=UPI003D0DDED2
MTALDQGFREQPNQILDALRTACPVHRDAEFDRIFLTRYEDVRATVNDRTLSVDPRKGRPAPNRPNFREMEDYEPSMLVLDDPDHKRLRGLVTQAFNARAIESARPRIRVVTERLLDGIGDASAFDLVDVLASPLPTIVIAEMLGVDPGDQADFKRWSDGLIQGFNPRRTPEQEAALEHGRSSLRGYLARIVEQRRAARTDDLISALVDAEEAGERLSTREIISTCNLLLVAGNMTTTDLIGNGVLALLENPDQLAKLRSRPALMKNAVEEMLRYDPPVVQTGRITQAPKQIGDKSLESEEWITPSLMAAGHDPAVHQNPHSFDIERADTSHLAFGGGVHFCLGAPLARAEAEIAIGVLLERFPNLRRDPCRPSLRKSVPVFNGVETLWVAVD